jgi:hypothetical protein
MSLLTGAWAFQNLFGETRWDRCKFPGRPLSFGIQLCRKRVIAEISKSTIFKTWKRADFYKLSYLSWVTVEYGVGAVSAVQGHAMAN